MSSIVLPSCHVVIVVLSLTFAIAGVQKHSEAALLHVRVDGMARARSFSAHTVWSAAQGTSPYHSVEPGLAHPASNYSLLLLIVGANSEPLRAGAGAIRARNFMCMKYSKFDLSARPATRRYVLNFE